MSLLFAATYPERVQSLVIYGAMARFSRELPDHPWGFTAEEKALHLEEIESHWGEGALAEMFFNEIADVPGFRDYYGRYQRTSASPTMAAWLWKALLEIDVRGVLGSIRAPTLAPGATRAIEWLRSTVLRRWPLAFPELNSRHWRRGRTGCSMTRWVRRSSTS